MRYMMNLQKNMYLSQNKYGVVDELGFLICVLKKINKIQRKVIT